jgi:hypothetical protein
MQREYEIGRSGDGRPSPTRRPSSGARRVVEPSGRAAASGTGRGAAIRRDVQRALSSRTTLQRAFLLSEILGPPKAFQSNLEQTWEPSAASLPPRGSAEPENGRQHYDETTLPRLNGHATGQTNGHTDGHTVSETGPQRQLADTFGRPAALPGGSTEETAGPPLREAASPRAPTATVRDAVRSLLGAARRAVRHALRRI